MATYTSLVLRPLELKLPRGNPLMAANFKTATIAAKTRGNMRPLNPIPPFIGLSSTRRTAVSVSKSSPSSTLTDDGNCNGNPCLDLFLNFRYAEKAGAGRNHLEELLSLAWSHNPLTALKLIYKILQDCSFGTGEEDTFRTVTFWIHNNHPKTLARNVTPIAGAHDIEGQDVSQQHQQNAAVVERYEHDPEYRFFHEFISDIFVECLKSDIEKLKKKNSKQPNDDQDNWWKITSAADSCLSLGNNFSDSALLLQSIARKVFPRESYPEYRGVEEAEYADSVRDRLTKEVLLPMDKLDEAYKYYGSTDDTYLEKLKAHQKYWENLKVDKSKIEADALLPHQILSYVNHWNFAQVAELQWKAMVEGIKKQGKLNGKKILNNCLAVCNLRYMFKPGMRSMDASVGFALLMSELNEEPWKGKVDFEKVLDLILEEAVNGNLKPEQMIKKVFVFTDSTDFDNARSKPNNEESDDEDSVNSWKIIYEGIQRKYKEKGYDNAVPHIMYWKMWSCLSDPRWWVKSSEQPGVTTLEGTADNLLKLVLDNGGEISLDLIMEATISGKEYQKLLVVD
ncbi:uncharacterized protein LOC18777260 [Prunus persica]|uniref:uncharacterized protein LOC18777260 n=1 Tax=Prunus persica TaxID=3760 RepID=UPI0009AB4F6C|nr:uncharacterized protein LOC18777260 [Prunus persica]